MQGRIEVIFGADSPPYLVIQGAVVQSTASGWLGDRLRSLSSTLAAARKKVLFVPGEGFLLPGAVTNDGNPVASVSGELIAGIAFEKVLRRRFNPRDFGLYSAFCTHVDFPCALHKKSCLKELIDHHFEAYREGFPDNGLVEAAQEVQSRIFPFPIWGPGIATDPSRSLDALQAAVAKLDPVQKTQVVLLNGMHGAGIFVALATVTGINTFEQYKDFQSAGFAPDSEEEQFLRISSSFIDLFGSLASGCPGYAESATPKPKAAKSSKVGRGDSKGSAPKKSRRSENERR